MNILKKNKNILSRLLLILYLKFIIFFTQKNPFHKSFYENGNNILKTTNSDFFKSNKNIAINGGFRNITGITLVDYINIENDSKLSVFYNGDNGKGFFCVKKIINYNNKINNIRYKIFLF